jgi:TPR repeat protein
VGISKYPSASGFSALHYAATDANDLAAFFKQQGYLVRVLTDTDAMRGSIEQSLHDLSDMVDGQQGTFLFYFSGHGFSIQGKNYLVPISASVSTLERDGLAVEEVEQLLGKSNAKRQLMLLDACRSDESSGAKGNGGRSFSAFQEAEGLRILNSTRIGRVSYESDDLRHGVFTAFVLKGLEGAAGSDGLVSFHDLSDYVTDSVRRWSNDHGKVQVPFETVWQAEASGDFLLASAAANSGKAPTTPTPLKPVAPPAVAPTPSGNYSTDDVAVFQAAVRSNDADQMEAAAQKVSNPYMANGLRVRAERLRLANGNGNNAPLTSIIPNQTSSQAVSAQADQFYAQKNYARAFALYRQAADAGDAHSMAGVGLLYYKGLGTGVNYAAAGCYFQQAAQLGERSIVSLMGSMYTIGRGVPKDAALALKYNRQGAELGDASSMYLMGYVYQNGFGVPKDTNQTVAWYRKSAAQGYLKAQTTLMDMGVR